MSTISDISQSTAVEINAWDEREALIGAYSALGGDKWFRKDNWGSKCPIDEWYGVKTNKHGKVIKIQLDDNNLAGFWLDIYNEVYIRSLLLIFFFFF